MPTRRPLERTASNTFTVPTTLTAAPSGGFAAHSGSCRPARWTMWVMARSRTTCATASVLVTSSATKSTSSPRRGWEMSSKRRRSARRSLATTAVPSSRSRRTTHAPMQPDAPVTRKRSPACTEAASSMSIGPSSSCAPVPASTLARLAAGAATSLTTSATCATGSRRASASARRRAGRGPVCAAVRPADRHLARLDPAEPLLHPRDVHDRPGGRDVGLVRLERVDDGEVLGPRALERVRVGDAAPDPRPVHRPRQRVEERDEHRVAAEGVDAAVELAVVLDEALRGRARRHLVEEPAELCHLLGRRAASHEGDGVGLEDAADLEEVEDRVVPVEVDDEAHRVEQDGRAEARHVGAVALTDVEDEHEAEGAHRLAQRATRQAAASRELVLLGQPVARAEAARHDHLLDLLDRLVGHRHGATIPSPRAAGRLTPPARRSAPRSRRAPRRAPRRSGAR